jgi:competence protein ComEA
MKKLLVLCVASLMFCLPAFAAIDLNTASQAELESIDGVGPKKAQAILEYRKKNGNFKSVDDLDKVSGFGKKTVDGMRKEITVGNAKAAAAGKPEKVVKPVAVVPAAKPVAPVAKPVTPVAPVAKDKAKK